MRLKIIGTLLTCALVATAARVTTITNGEPDGNRHPYVGVIIQPIPDMPGFFSICSGTALSPTTFLTAAHCADQNQPVLVSYKSEPPFSLSKDFVWE